ncbi:hypothetical protein LJC07_07365 [Christensenellaceae bacterium OttesenSCG-928-L17]|nr:hypothetical protein [Christensenellaceae bacterium OttesenSCG-928-L17]
MFDYDHEVMVDASLDYQRGYEQGRSEALGGLIGVAVVALFIVWVVISGHKGKLEAEKKSRKNKRQ